MITIAENKQYTLQVNKAKNRAFLTINGFWRAVEISNYLNDWDKALASLTKGFTLLTDATKMKIHPADVRTIHEAAQKKIINAGAKKVAELQNEKISEMQLDGVSKATSLPKKNFIDREEALKWLDQ